MKKKTIVLWLIVIVLSLAAACRTNDIFIRKTAGERLYSLMESPNDIDIFLLGSSRIMDGIIPMELWKSKGYTSQILCCEYNDMDRNIMMLRLAMQYKKPRLVVIDVHNFWKKSEIEHVVTGYREYADAFPLSREKIKTTLQLYEDYETRMSLLFPFLIYHNRWNELSGGDFGISGVYRAWKGYEYITEKQEIELPDPISLNPEEHISLPDVYGVKSIAGIVEYCNYYGIDVCMLVLPFEADTMEQQYLFSLYQLAAQLNIPYINMLEMPVIVDKENDFKDGGHLNYYGALKATDALGECLSEIYELPDSRENPAVAYEWDNDYKNYLQLVEQSKEK